MFKRYANELKTWEYAKEASSIFASFSSAVGWGHRRRIVFGARGAGGRKLSGCPTPAETNFSVYLCLFSLLFFALFASTGYSQNEPEDSLCPKVESIEEPFSQVASIDPTETVDSFSLIVDPQSISNDDEAEESDIPLPKLCLHMIVKNEAQVIRRCLDSVKSLIDYWVIVDTGSTDGTQEIIQEYLTGIPGELHEISWKNWGETRSEAIAFAKDKAEYILLMDADDILEYEGPAELPPLTQDQYCMWRGSKSFTYKRPQIIKGDLPWRYVGVTHEYLDCAKAFTSTTLETVKYITLDDGAVSRDPKQKFLKNIDLLEEGLKNEPKNERYAFYLAESYRDAGEKGKALETYQKRIEMGGWDQEVFWSKLQIAHILRDLKFPPSLVLEAYKDAHTYRPFRSEPIYFQAEILNQLNRYEESYQLLKMHELFPKPSEKDALFNVDWIDDYGLLFQFSICSYYVNRFEESLDACDELLRNVNLPEEWRSLAEANRTFPMNKLKEKIAIHK